MEQNEDGRAFHENFNSTQWCIKISQAARGSNDTATKSLFRFKVKGNPNLDLIRLGMGDPSVYGNFNPPSVALDAILGQLEEGKQSHAEGPPCGEGFGADRTCKTVVILYIVCSIVHSACVSNPSPLQASCVPARL